VRNVLNTNARREQEQEDAKAKQRMDAGIADQRAKAKAKNPDKDYSIAKLKGAYQANRTAAHTAKTIKDLISRSNANSAKAQSQGLSLTPAQSLRHEIDKIRTQNKANAAKAAQTKQASAVINLLAPTVIKALTAKPVAPVAAAAPISDAAIGDATQALKAAVKSIDPNKTFSFNELKEGSVNILSGNGKTSAVQDYLASNKAEQSASTWQKGVENRTGYPLTQAFQDGAVRLVDEERKTYLTNPDGFIQQGLGNLLDAYVNHKNKKTKPATKEQKIKALKEIGTIAGEELVGGSMKIIGTRVKGPRGGIMDYVGDRVLQDAERKKKAWGYKK